MKNKLTVQAALILTAICMLFVSCSGNGSGSVRASAAERVDLVYTNPGEDCSSSIRFSWHSSESEVTLLCAKASNESFFLPKKVKCQGVFTPVAFHDGEEYYQFEAELNHLSKNTDYIYKFRFADGAESDTYAFSTADNDGEFGFLWIGDVHSVADIPHRMELAEELAASAEVLLEGDMDLVVSTGDEVCYGAYYSAWQQWQHTFINQKVWAGIPGNHTYYDVFDGDQEIVDERWWDATQNQPMNGPEGQASSFWFKYDSILFIGIDCIDSSHINEQKKWFKKVIESNEGQYQYIVVFEHYPYINSFTGSFGGTDVSFFLWQPVFDQYGVDLALSGDSHVYLESKPLYKKKVSADPEKNGTTYFVSPQIGDRAREIESYVSPELFEARITSADLAQSSGLSAFKVTKEGMTHYLLDGDGNIVHETFIKAKRPYTGK